MFQSVKTHHFGNHSFFLLKPQRTMEVGGERGFFWEIGNFYQQGPGILTKSQRVAGTHPRINPPAAGSWIRCQRGVGSSSHPARMSGERFLPTGDATGDVWAGHWHRAYYWLTSVRSYVQLKHMCPPPGRTFAQNIYPCVKGYSKDKRGATDQRAKKCAVWEFYASGFEQRI